MRLLEIASAEEQIALFKLVSDSVWQALTTQQKQQADAEAAKQYAAKLKPKTGLKDKLHKVAKVPQLPIQKSAQPQQQKVVQQAQSVPQNNVWKSQFSTQKSPVTNAAVNNRDNGRQA